MLHVLSPASGPEPARGLRLIAILLAATALGACSVDANLSSASSAPVSVPESSLSATPSAASGSATPLPVYMGPESEYLPLLAACLGKAGWQVEANSRGDEMSGVIPPEQRSAFEAAQQACQAQIGTPPTPRPLTQEEIRTRYDYLVEMRQCLMDLGYTLSEPPTFEVFVDSWATGPWSPYNEVADVANRDQWAEANEKCPQVVLGS